MKLALTAAWCLVLAGVVACTRDDPVAPSLPLIASGPSFDFFVQPPGDGGQLCWASAEGQAHGGNWWEPRGPNCRTQLQSSPLPYFFHDADTGPYDVVADFSEPVSNLVITPLGPWMCGGDPGSFTVYTASGETVTFAMPTPDESNCDQVVYVLPNQPQCSDYSIIKNSIPQGVPVGVADIVRVVIHPNSPLHFTEYSYHRVENCGTEEIPHVVRASTTYIFAFREFDQPTQDLVLSCDRTTVTRGESILCQSYPVPATAPMTITEWRFDSPIGFAAVRPATAAGRDWGGVIGTSGTMSLTASVGGRSFTRTIDISVIPRDWNGHPVTADIQEKTNNHLPLLVTKPMELGDVHRTLRDRYEAVTVVISDGPNTDLAYLGDLPFVHEARIHINRQALAKGSQFSNRHPVMSTPGGFCTRTYLESTVPVLALAHEGLNREPNSHSWFYHQGVEQANLGPTVEGLIGIGRISDEMRNSVSDVLKAVHTAADAADQADQVNKVQFTCTLKYYKP